MMLKKRIAGKGILALFLGVISLRTFGSEIIKTQSQDFQVMERKTKSKNYNENSLNDTNSFDCEVYSAYSANSFNAYSESEYVYIPYGNRGKYDNYSQGEEMYYQTLLSNERWLSETNDSRVKYWSDTKYDFKSINGNDYDYVGEYKRLYAEQGQVGDVYYRDIYKKKISAKYETKYLHTYHGAHWWNYLLVTVRITPSSDAPSVNNFKRISTTSFEEFKGWDTKEEFYKREYSEWRTSKPFRWIGEPEWKLFTTQEKYRLYIEDIKKWNWQGDNKFLKLPSVSLKEEKIMGDDILGLHLTPWYGVSSVNRDRNGNRIIENKDPIFDKVKKHEAGRVDFFYFNNRKVLEIILDEVIDAKDKLDYFLDKENISKREWKEFLGDFGISSLVTALSTIISSFASNAVGLASSLGLFAVSIIIDAIETGKKVNRLSNKRDQLEICSDEMKAKLRNKANLLNNKYTILKITEDGYWIDFADKVDNPYDDVNTVSLKYANNKNINGALHQYSNNNFTDFYGYPTYVTDLRIIREKTIEVIGERGEPPMDYKLNNLVEQGTYSTLFW